MKLLVKNDEGKILLVKWEGSWELPGSKYDTPESIKGFLESMGGRMGVKIQNHKLFGLYTQRWKGDKYLILMHYYQAGYVSGKLNVPPACTDIRWFTMEEALETIPYENMRFMIKWLIEKPGQIASAAFERYQDEQGLTQFDTLEDWKSLND